MRRQSFPVLFVLAIVALLVPLVITSADQPLPIAPLDCVPPPASLVSWWPADGEANDIQGINHGTLQNGATFGVGQVGGAFQLDGVDDFVLVPDSNALDLTRYTFETWIYSQPFSAEFRTILSKGEFFQENYALFLYSDGVLHHVVHVGGVRYSVNTPPHAVPFNTWVHVAGTYDGTVLTTYVNGQVAGTLSLVGQADTNSRALRIGHREADVYPSYFDGFIDELAVYNQALSASEIHAIFNAGSAGKCKALDQCALQLSQCQADLTAADQESQALEAQVNALTAHNAQLQQDLQNSQSQLARLTTVLTNGLVSLTNDFRSVFNDSTFVIPGATIEEQYQNLITAILNLNKGRKQGLYVNRDGKPGN